MEHVEHLTQWLGAHLEVRNTLLVLTTGLAGLLSLYITRQFIVRGMTTVVRKTTSGWDDVLEQRRVFEKLAWVAPAVVFYYAASMFAHRMEALILRLLNAYLVLVVVITVGAFLSAVIDVYSQSRLAKEVPLKGYIQVLRLVVYLSAGIVIMSVLLNRSPWVFLSGLGAAAAVLSLVFKDTILSFVASVQIASNDIVRVGDSIEMPKFDADGEVVDIALHRIKVQNNDLTITMIPTFKFVEESFKNWRGIDQAGARRIKRAVLIDQASIGFVDEATIDRLAKVHLLSTYVRDRSAEIERHNAGRGFDPTILVNGRRMTNIGTFRAYLVAYLKSHPKVRHDMPCVVRQLAPGPTGLPLEIYAFVSETAWGAYESLQADIFDHILAALPEFGLHVYQGPLPPADPMPRRKPAAGDPKPGDDDDD